MINFVNLIQSNNDMVIFIFLYKIFLNKIISVYYLIYVECFHCSTLLDADENTCEVFVC